MLVICSPVLVYVFTPKRVSREHSTEVSEGYKNLSRRIRLSSSVGELSLTREMAQKDLDELEWLIQNKYSYLDRRGVDYRMGLDAIRSSLGTGISRGEFSAQLIKFMALFGDGHSGISDPSLSRLCSKFSPFLVEESGGRLIAIKADRSGFLDGTFPYLRGIDGLEISEWLDAAGLYTAQGSPQYLRYHAIRNLRYVDCLRKELGLDGGGLMEIELESADGKLGKRIEVSLVDEKPFYGVWPRSQNVIGKRDLLKVPSRVLPGNIGYLRVMLMLDKPEFLAGLVEGMNKLKDTDSLIIDIRGNGGGSRRGVGLFVVKIRQGQKDKSKREMLEKVLKKAAVTAVQLGVSEKEVREHFFEIVQGI